MMQYDGNISKSLCTMTFVLISSFGKANKSIYTNGEYQLSGDTTVQIFILGIIHNYVANSFR